MKALSRAVFYLPQQFLMGLVKAYRLLLSPWLGSSCRFEPTCSAYSLQALQQHGAVAGSALTIYRLARCQPWCQGGHDPVPVAGLFSRLVAFRATSTTSPLSSEKKQS
jgi:putative membrane protein insertion efficiency factor